MDINVPHATAPVVAITAAEVKVAATLMAQLLDQAIRRKTGVVLSWEDAQGFMLVLQEATTRLQDLERDLRQAEQELRLVVAECNQVDVRETEGLWPSAAQLVRAKLVHYDELLTERQRATPKEPR